MDAGQNPYESPRHLADEPAFWTWSVGMASVIVVGLSSLILLGAILGFLADPTFKRQSAFSAFGFEVLLAVIWAGSQLLAHRAKRHDAAAISGGFSLLAAIILIALGLFGLVVGSTYPMDLVVFAIVLVVGVLCGYAAITMLRFARHLQRSLDDSHHTDGSNDTPQDLVGLMADEPELVDQVMENVNHTRETQSLRKPADEPGGS